jgi:hypothetical protein
MRREHFKTPTPVAVAIYSDHLMRDYSRMTKKNLVIMMGWLRPAGIGLAIFFAYYIRRSNLKISCP